MSKQNMRRIPEETLKLCHDIAVIVVKKQRAEERKNVVTNPLEINSIRQREFVVTFQLMSRQL